MRIAQNRAAGRPKKGDSPVSTDGLAKELGVSPKTARERVRAADAVDTYPFMEGWKEYRVLEAREQLDALPEETKSTMAEMLSETVRPGNPQLLHDETIGLEEIGVSRIQSHRWQQVAQVPLPAAGRTCGQS